MWFWPPRCVLAALKEAKAAVLDFSINGHRYQCDGAGIAPSAARKFDAEIEQHLCTCGKPLLVRYDLKTAAATLTGKILSKRVRTLWRYREVLPQASQ